MKVIGYKIGGKTYGIATHLGCVYASDTQINGYFGKKRLEEDYKDACNASVGKHKHKEIDLSFGKKFQGGRVFITDVKSSKCEFIVTPKHDTDIFIKPSDSSGTVALRCKFSLKEVDNATKVV